MLNHWNERLKNHPLLAGAVLVLVVFTVYAGSLANDFVYDDVPQILENPFVVNRELWSRIFTGSVWSFQGAGVHGNFYRPLQFFSYWLVYRLAGPNPAAFHIVHLLLYAATVLLVWRLGRALLQNELAAFVSALLWALHPLHVEAVAWISALPDAGVGFFYVLAFLLFLRAENSARNPISGHALAALAFLPALFFKEMALSFPLMLVAYWVFLAGRPGAGGWLGRAIRWTPYLAAVAAYIVIRTSVLHHFTEAAPPWKLSRRVVGAAVGLLGEHARIFIWPTQLNVFRGFELGPSLHSPWPWLTILGLLVALGVRKRVPLLTFLVAWWLVALLPVLDIRQISFPLLAERFSYLPSVGLCLAISFLAFLWLPQRLPKVQLARFVVPGLALVMSLWIVQIVLAIPNWRDNQILVEYSIRQSPNSAMLHYSRGVELQFRFHDFEGATREFETALQLNKASFWPLTGIPYDTYICLGQIAYGKGQREEAISYFEKAVRISRMRSQAFDALGSVYFPRGDYAKAAEYFSKAVQVNHYDLGARFYLGTCWMKLGKYREAAEQFHAAAEIEPTYWQAREAEARALEAAGDPTGAARVRSLPRKP